MTDHMTTTLHNLHDYNITKLFPILVLTIIKTLFFMGKINNGADLLKKGGKPNLALILFLTL